MQISVFGIFEAMEPNGERRTPFSAQVRAAANADRKTCFSKWTLGIRHLSDMIRPKVRFGNIFCLQLVSIQLTSIDFEFMQKYRIIARPNHHDCVVIQSPADSPHPWIGQLLLFFQCQAIEAVIGGTSTHTLALVRWFDWVGHDEVLGCDVYRLLPPTNLTVIALASIRRQVVMMPGPAVTPDLFYRNRFADMFLHDHR